MKFHVVTLGDVRGGPIAELHIMGVGVTQYSIEGQDPELMVLDYLRLNAEPGELEEWPEIVFHDGVLEKVRGGWRGSVHTYREDTLSFCRTRREAFDEALRLFGQVLAEHGDGDEPDELEEDE